MDDKHNKAEVKSKAGDVAYALGTPYRWTVGKITDAINPALRRITEKFLADAIERNNAQDNPRLQKLLKFEIERRAYGPGQTQDVAEPALWQGVKIAAALVLPVFTKGIEDKIDKGHKYHLTKLSLGAAAVVLIKESIEYLRLTNRFVAGLQGSEKMALDRERTIVETGFDPFSASIGAPKKPNEDNGPKTETQTPRPSPKMGSSEKLQQEAATRQHSTRTVTPTPLLDRAVRSEAQQQRV